MITAEQAYENARPVLKRKESEQNILEGQEFRQWLTQIEEASKKGETYITVQFIHPWQNKELKRLGFSTPYTLGTQYISWYPQKQTTTQLTWLDKLKEIFGD